MCTHIVRATYRAQGEPPMVLPFDNLADARARIVDLQKLETVSAIQLFNLVATSRRVETWSEETHE